MNLEQLADEEDTDENDDLDSNAESMQRGIDLPFNLNPDKDAQLKIPKPWLTPEKVLSIEFEDEVTIHELPEGEIPKSPEKMYEKMQRAYVKWHEQSYAAGMLKFLMTNWSFGSFLANLCLYTDSYLVRQNSEGLTLFSRVHDSFREIHEIPHICCTCCQD